MLSPARNATVERRQGVETVVAAFNYLGAIIVLRCNEIMIVGHRWSADISASNEGYPKVRNHGKGPTWAFSWLKAATTAFTFKTLLRHYAKRVLTPQSLNMKLGPQCNYHEGQVAIKHYANQPARPL